MTNIASDEPIRLDNMVVLDFEASCFPQAGSYPIEVGVATLDGWSAGWLIRPTADWLRNGVWDLAAARTHGITMEMLQQDGLDPAAVVQELDQVLLPGRPVFSDAAGAETFWLGALYAAVGREPPVVIEPLQPVLEGLTSGGLYAAGEIDAAEYEAALGWPTRHRAEPDARRLAEVVRILAGIR
ncbi:hypothetical protein [Roseomonas genomospecies 6]|uniref:Exonuclease domain-containing protein n=1 Tax=Roseomonas genomospecies 6 TaxID=214106 RepID=A0A9W7KS84_9PROT|nr:hypothetical protein [Roseomonas genomospecies 6]KAA0677679.1 hypothetical protein DS843_22840 [Roseomonas genomospecies 6]